MFKVIRIFLVLILLSALSFAFTASANITITQSTLGNNSGFDFELWTQYDDDDVKMTITGPGTFIGEWNDAYNVLFRTGQKLGNVSTYKEYGDITIEYGAIHDIIKGDVSYLCVYGWTKDPLIEFYVVDNYGSYKPPGRVGHQGKIEVDGGTYDVYVATRTGQPSIVGTATFEQYFSVRAEKRTEGTITLHEHFKAWEEFGMDMSGTLYEVALCVEGYKSSGYGHVYSHVLTIGDNTYGSSGKSPLDETDDTIDFMRFLWLPVLVIVPVVFGALTYLIIFKKRRKGISE